MHSFPSISISSQILHEFPLQPWLDDFFLSTLLFSIVYGNIFNTTSCAKNRK
ncbi:hypothetical protein KFK09_001819 [Dendrobium nobile]|uniref:Uncharacterized protein n=1 Tax=Dendrobium nobile TaxID=94219 RepID=A0A8T3CC02_DENNO|nr:hypothetical protein KFK09_001819 [Dendrobium nobile]